MPFSESIAIRLHRNLQNHLGNQSVNHFLVVLYSSYFEFHYPYLRSFLSMMLEGVDSDYGWKARGDFLPEESKRCYRFLPKVIHAVKLIPMLVRLFFFCVKEWIAGRGAFIDMFTQMKHDPYTGVPLGGIGCGSIGTDFRGAFNKFSIIPGIKEQHCHNIKADQFILTVRNRLGKTVYWSLLTCADFNGSELKYWDQKFRKTDVQYRGLFPRAWREFIIESLNIKVLMQQTSPVIPNNYEDTSLPVATFNFVVINNSDNDYDVSIAFTFRNGTGNKKWNKEGICVSKEFSRSNFRGCSLDHTIRGLNVTYAIAAADIDSNEITISNFNPSGDGSQIREVLESQGSFSGNAERSAKELGIAVCSQSFTPAHSAKNHLFSLVWYMPNIHFPLKNRTYKRRYTRFFNDLSAVVDITSAAFSRHGDWNNSIREWQKPVLDDDSLPTWYKSALFNELYFVVDGSTIWVEYDETWVEQEKSMSVYTQEWFKKYGRFAYMESWEYYMYNTYDVHFYASWALLQNWPSLEMGIQYDFVDQNHRYDGQQLMSMFTGKSFDRAEPMKTPHDLGHPMGDPWYQINAYQLHDTSHWRDLNLKLVPMSWRDWKMIIRKNETPEKSMEILDLFFKRCQSIVDQALKEWDIDSDFMIENSGSADQTYDVWTMTGTSAYCGSLWLCALSCLSEMAVELGYENEHDQYSGILLKAADAYEKKLHNGWYYKFDENHNNEKVIMSDQLCGVWFLSMINSKQPLKEDRIKKALHVLFTMNGKSFENGQYGPVNGYKQEREVDTSCIQSEEIWTGIAYALASFFICKGMKEEGFHIAKGIYNSCWNRFGLQWQTPEAITIRPGFFRYRAIGYMRPLSIWSMQFALTEFADLTPSSDLPDHPWMNSQR